MRKSILHILLFLFFLIEGTVIQYISPDFYGYNLVIIPRFVLVFIVFISIYKDQKYAMVLGLIFGVLYDLIYGYVFGVYMIGMIGTAYLSGWLTQFLHPTLPVYTLIQFISLIAFEFFVFGMKNLYQLARRDIGDYLPGVMILHQ